MSLDNSEHLQVSIRDSAVSRRVIMGCTVLVKWRGRKGEPYVRKIKEDAHELYIKTRLNEFSLSAPPRQRHFTKARPLSAARGCAGCT